MMHKRKLPLLFAAGCCLALGATLLARERLLRFAGGGGSGELPPPTPAGGLVQNARRGGGRVSGAHESPADAHGRLLRRVEALRAAGDLSGLAALADEINNKKEELGVERYADLMLAVSGTLASYDFKDDRQYALARKYAALALEHADGMPLETEIRLALYLQGDDEPRPDPAGAEEWSQERSRRARHWLHAWQRLEKEVDSRADADDRPLLSVMPPPGAHPRIPGISPEAIKDPKLRAQYEAAIAANRRKIEHYNRQHELRQLDQLFTKRAEEYVIKLYSTPPYNLEELRQYLNSYLMDQRVRERVLVEVDKKISGASM